MRQIQQRLAAEKVRLELREVEDAHAELDRKAEAKANERQRLRDQEAEQALAKARARDEAKREAAEALRSAERREAEKRERQEKRRNVIQEVKRQAVDWWYAGLVPSDFKPRACLAIERELTTLAIEEIPLPELVRLAEGIRDRMHRDEKAKVEQATRVAGQRQRLIQHGTAYAQRELREIDGLSFSDSWRIESAVKADLEAIAGTETPADIEDRVEQVFDRYGLGCEDEDDD